MGNETCVDALDVLERLIEQDDVRVVALYIEGLDDASRVLRIAERARDKDVQIVVLKAGRSVVGQQATASHTGKIASSKVVYVLDQAGVTSVDSLFDALHAVEVLAYLPHPRVSGDPQGGASVLSSSGGAGALFADHSSEYGIPVAELSPDTAETLEAILPEFARKANPVDLAVQSNYPQPAFRPVWLKQFWKGFAPRFAPLPKNRRNPGPQVPSGGGPGSRPEGRGFKP